MRRLNEIIGARESFKLRARFTAIGILYTTLDISIDTWKDGVSGIKVVASSMGRHTSFLMHLLLSKREKKNMFPLFLLAQTYLCSRGATSEGLSTIR